MRKPAAGELGAAATYETIRSRGDFSALAPAWDALVRAKRRPSPFLLHGWLDAWWTHHGGERVMQVHVARRGDVLLGGIPLEIERRLGWRVATFMGRHHAALADLLLAEDAPAAVAGRLCAEIARAGGHYGDFFGLSEDSALARFAPEGARLIQRVEAPVLRLAGGWDAVYRERTSSKRRNLHRRRRRQLEQLGTLRVRVAATTDELAPALEAAFELHDLRRSDRPDGSEFTTPAGKGFHRAALRALGLQGIPRILLLELDGRPIAFQYFLLFERTMFVHRLAFDPQLARYSPGQLALLAAIECAAEEGAERVEFLGGGERYKLELADGNEPMHQLIGFASGPRGAAGSRLAAAAVSARLALKRSDSLRRLYHEGLAPVRARLRRARAG